MTHILAIVSIVLYIAVTVSHLIRLWRPRSGEPSSRLARIGFTLGFAAHSAVMVAVANDPRVVVLDNGGDYFLWVSWATAFVFAVFRRRLEYPIVGAFVVPAIVLFMGSSSYLLHQKPDSLASYQQGESAAVAWLSLLHGVPALVSVVSVAMALVVSIVFLIVERRLKSKPGLSLRTSGPNLELLDALNKNLAQVGFVALSLVILTGGLWAVSQQKAVFSLDTSVVSGLILWVLLALVLHGRLVLQWSPQRISRVTVVAAGSFIVSVFAVMGFAGRITHVSLWS